MVASTVDHLATSRARPLISNDEAWRSISEPKSMITAAAPRSPVDFEEERAANKDEQKVFALEVEVSG